MNILKNIGWSLLVIVGLIFALQEFLPHQARRFVKDTTQFTRPTELRVEEAAKAIQRVEEAAKAIQKKVVSAGDIPATSAGSLPPPEIAMAMGPQKDWTDWVDKIIGWIAALAGSWKLINEQLEKRRKKQRNPRTR